ncbi:MAG: 3-hydroxyacyl-CoA dehydrogenase NAD-binding domain-containing protein, partial [Alphaproteobacteria bacterium]|nr:3-hydroxyacyl-CoA dehydrogenase NAD-binding domain-containing protein [Alphaproteobacteria bacterium]
MIDYKVDGDGVATITWDVDNRPMNVMNHETMSAYIEALERAIADDGVKGVIVASAHPEFIVGADLSAMGNTDGMGEFEEFIRVVHGMFRRMETCGKPFVAAINGHALGGGFEICLACHGRIAADNPRIKIGLPEAKVGLLPGGGGTQRLPRLIGMQQALPLMLEGRELAPAKALALGMIDKVVPADDLLAEAKAWVLGDGQKAAVQPWDKKGFKLPGGAVQSPMGQQAFVAGNAMLHKRTYGNYPAQQHIMSCVYEGCQVDIDTGLTIEARYFLATATTKEAKNLIRFFFAMTEANKGAGRPADIAPAELAKIGILGAGMMGAGIAHVTAMAGLSVVLLDTELANAEKGKGYAEGLLKKRVSQKRMSRDQADEVLGRIRPSADFADLAGCDLVVEAVFEDRAIKAEVTQKTLAVTGDGIVFASNTSTLPISGLAEASSRPDNFIGLHFFSPVDRMPLVEIIRGRETSDETLAKAIDYVKAIRKTPIVVNDSRGFYTSRVFATYVREGLAMLAEGVTPALLENAGKMAGMPVGPLALADEVSIELMYRIGRQTQEDLGDDYVASPADGLVQHMVEDLGRLGKKAGKGFYDYPGDGPKRLWPGLAAEFPVVAEQPDVEEVKKRVMYIQSVETARCMEEGVVTENRDADVGSIM